MYADDNNDRFPLSISATWNSWVTGRMDYDPDNRSNWDVEQDIKKSPFSPLWQRSGDLQMPGRSFGDKRAWPWQTPLSPLHDHEPTRGRIRR